MIGKAWFLLAIGLASGGSTCHGQSSGGDATKDPGPVVDVNLAEVDTSSLTPREKKEWSSYVSELLAPCADTPVPIAQCVSEKRACSKCLPAAKMILKGVRDGGTKEMIETSYHNRFDADKVKDVRIEDSPSRGPTGAPIVIVEWADFECPHCQATAPVLEKLCDDHKSDLRFVYKFMPLDKHTHAEPAARAAIAAGMQGKFWEMHHKLFANPEHLEQSDIENYAREIGIDVVKFRADMQSKNATDRIAADRKQADELKVQGTPTIYINGRLYDHAQSFDEWVALELNLLGAAAPAPTAPALLDASAGDAGKK